MVINLYKRIGPIPCSSIPQVRLLGVAQGEGYPVSAHPRSAELRKLTTMNGGPLSNCQVPAPSLAGWGNIYLCFKLVKKIDPAPPRIKIH